MLHAYLRYADNSALNAKLFYSWEWLMQLAHTQPEEAWQAFLWLANQRPDMRTSEVIGCGPLQDFLWLNAEYEERFIAAAHSQRSFYEFARWCELDAEHVGAKRVEAFRAKLQASPLASQHDA